MRCFKSCFGNCKHKKIIKPCTRSYNKINSISPKTLQNLLRTHENGEASVAIINATKEEAQLEDATNLINLIQESKNKEEEEEELNRSSRKKVTFDDVNISSIINERGLANQESANCLEEICKKEKEKEKANVKEEEEEEEEGNTFPPSHRYHCCRNSDDEFEAIDLNDSSDVEDDDANNNNEINDDEIEFSENAAMIQQEQSSESSLFSLSIDSRKRNPTPEMGEKEVNSPLKLSTQSINFSAKDRSQLSVLNPIQEKENINILNLPNFRISTTCCVQQEPSLKQSTKQTKRQEENQITVDTSLSSWLIESQDEDTPNSKNNVGDLVGNYSSSERTKSRVRVEDRPILGELTVAELKHIANSSSPRRLPTRSPDEKKPIIIGTVGSYLRHTGQEATDSDSASSCKGISSNKTYALLRKDRNNSSHSTPFQVRLERALDSGLARA
ncbi:PREDICTED: uncharacterized protein LOC109244018 [Nicotiana attenuata]|uniref:Uncharacterized protein n=1 Tax=Nicotiana attenuata TaxID=49451 RepID=A0A314L0E8_NICAT|nr:PREDICTED: uncharacterized protein LOC109244018 [Nicotiana attenuata]OIT34945.1 hypothetical protein A4A49_04125 [Nicotiana attenuata]